jgi:hypothetical protein
MIYPSRDRTNGPARAALLTIYTNVVPTASAHLLLSRLFRSRRFLGFRSAYLCRHRPK